MADSDRNDKLPISIVTTVIDKISEFTKEIEILRAQLPNKETSSNKLDAIDKKMGQTLFAIKIIFGLAMLVVALSFFGAKLIEWHDTKGNTTNNQVVSEVVDQMQTANKQMLDQLRDEIRRERRSDLDTILNDRDAKRDAKRTEEFKKIVDRIESLHKDDNKNKSSGK